MAQGCQGAIQERTGMQTDPSFDLYKFTLIERIGGVWAQKDSKDILRRDQMFGLMR